MFGEVLTAELGGWSWAGGEDAGAKTSGTGSMLTEDWGAGIGC